MKTPASLVRPLAAALLLASPSAPAATPDSFLVLGAGTLPEYEGSDELRGVPFVVSRWDFERARLDVTGLQARLGVPTGGGFRFGPTLGIVFAREEDGIDRAFMADRDASLELGAFAAWERELGTLDEGRLETVASLRTAVGGDWEGSVLDLSASYRFAATFMWRLQFGARASFVDEDYHVNRFGADDGAAVAAGATGFEPSGGLKSVAVDAVSIVSFGPSLGVFTRAAIERLVGDAADGPVVADGGDENQAFLGVGVFWRPAPGG